MIKKLRIYQISLIAVSMLCIGLLAFMGITAIQKSLTLNLSIKTNPTFLFKVGYNLDGSEAYTYFFCNTDKDNAGVSLANNVTLSGDTLTLNNLQVNGVGDEIYFKLINYTAVPEGEDYNFIKISGGGGNCGVAEFNASVNPCSNNTAQTVGFVVNVVALDSGKVSIPLNFEWMNGYAVTLSTDGSCQVASENAEVTSPTGYTATFQPNIASHSGYLKYMFDVNINGVESTRFSTDGSLTLTNNEIYGPVSISAKTYWNGQSPSADASSTFSGGTGASEQDPYILKDAYDLALLSSNVNAGTNYSGKYFKMANDIYLDIYKYDFNEASGFVRIKNYDDTILACVGQGITGTTTNTTGVLTSIYPASADTSTTLPGTLSEFPSTFTPNTWVPIGESSIRPFSGNFDGGNKKICGCYIWKIWGSSGQTNDLGFFGYANNGIIENVNIQNSCVALIAESLSYRVGVGAVAGTSYQIENCTFNGCVLVVSSYMPTVGGVAGYCNGGAISCKNYGFVNNLRCTSGLKSDYGTGGVLGKITSSSISNFYNNSNFGNVYGLSSTTGGVVGFWLGIKSVSDGNGVGGNFGKINGIADTSKIIGWALVDFDGPAPK
ncbi:MAG: hypothetical protein IKT27_04045 [Clostridia bacterium]|nr:hypothetical protein [Clostridia bacterium]